MTLVNLMAFLVVAGILCFGGYVLFVILRIVASIAAYILSQVVIFCTIATVILLVIQLFS